MKDDPEDNKHILQFQYLPHEPWRWEDSDVSAGVRKVMTEGVVIDPIISPAPMDHPFHR